MKKTIILNYFTIFCVLVYFALLGAFYFITGLIFPAWFSIACLFLCAYSFLKSYYFSLASNFLFASILFCVGTIGILKLFDLIPMQSLFALYFLTLPIGFTFTALFYKKIALYKISFILLLEDFLILLYSYNIFNIKVLIGVSVLLLLLIIGGSYVFNRNKRLQQK